MKDDYLNKLKEDDYIAWDSLVNDPNIKGQGDGEGCLLPVIVVILIVGLLCKILI